MTSDMGNCINLADIDQAVNCVDMDNVGGVAQEIIFGLWDDVAVWPKLPAPVSNTALDLAAAGQWDGDLVMKEGTRAYKLTITDDSGELTMTDQGETGAESVLMELTVHRAKANETIFGFENATRGRKMFLVVKDRNGKHYLMGDSNVAAKRVAADATTTGKASSDINKVPLKFSYCCPRKLFYNGDVENILKTAGPAS